MWELQESEERFRGLIDALGDLVVHRDREGGIVYANKVFADLVGKDQRDLVGQTLAQLGVDVGIVPGCGVFRWRVLELHRRGDPFVERNSLVLLDRAVGARQGERPCLAPRDRPRHHFAQARGNRADQCARARGICQPGEVAIPRHGEPRDPDADERHHGHGQAAGRHRAVARAADLCRRGFDLGQRAARPDRGFARLFQDRGRPVRRRAAADVAARDRRQCRRAACRQSLRQGHRPRLPRRARRAADDHRRSGPRAAGAAQSARQRDKVHRRGRRASDRDQNRLRQGRHDPLLGRRYRAGTAARRHRPHLRGVRAGRRQLDPHPWRRRSRSRHLQAPRRLDGRRDLGHKPAGQGVRLRVRDSGCRRDGRPADARRGARRTQGRRAVEERNRGRGDRHDGPRAWRRGRDRRDRRAGSGAGRGLHRPSGRRGYREGRRQGTQAPAPDQVSRPPTPSP